MSEIPRPAPSLAFLAILNLSGGGFASPWHSELAPLLEIDEALVWLGLGACQAFDSSQPSAAAGTAIPAAGASGPPQRASAPSWGLQLP